MSKNERWNAIIDLCSSNDAISVEELTTTLKVSGATIRRDLVQLEDLGIITRYHGGAKINADRQDEPDMMLKSNFKSSVKTSIARYAASLIKDHQYIYMDAGSSSLAMIPYISAKNITIVTIGIPHITKLMERGIQTIVLGGKVRTTTSAITGSITSQQIEKMFFDVAFIGTNSVHKMMGLCTSNDLEAEVKSKVISKATKTYILADESKFNKSSASSFASFDQVTILTNGIADFDPEKIDAIIV